MHAAVVVDGRQPYDLGAHDLEHGHPRRLVGVEMTAEGRLVDRALKAGIVRDASVEERLRQAQPRLVLRIHGVDREQRSDRDEREQQQLVLRTLPGERAATQSYAQPAGLVPRKR